MKKKITCTKTMLCHKLINTVPKINEFVLYSYLPDWAPSDLLFRKPQKQACGKRCLDQLKRSLFFCVIDKLFFTNVEMLENIF